MAVESEREQKIYQIFKLFIDFLSCCSFLSKQTAIIELTTATLTGKVWARNMPKMVYDTVCVKGTTVNICQTARSNISSLWWKKLLFWRATAKKGLNYRIWNFMIIVCLCETSISSIAKIYLKMRSQISSMSCSKILLVATCTFPFWMFISHEYSQLDVGHFKGFMLIPKLDDLLGWNFKYCPTSFLDFLQNLTTKALCKHFVFPFPHFEMIKSTQYNKK